MKNKIMFIFIISIIFCLISTASAADFGKTVASGEIDTIQIDEGFDLNNNEGISLQDNSNAFQNSQLNDSFESIGESDEALNDIGSDKFENNKNILQDSQSGSSVVLDDSSLSLDASQSGSSVVLDDSSLSLDASQSDSDGSINALLEGHPNLKNYYIDFDSLLSIKNPSYGIVDFGSKTICLEIYEVKNSGKIKSIFDVSEPSVTAIYREDNKLTQKGIEKLLDIYDDFIELMDFLDIKTQYFFATASLRKIDNCDEVLTAVKQQLGVEIDLISGEHEAELSFNSIKNKDLTRDEGIAIDLGGGSCEVIDFINKTPITSESMPIGAFSTYDEYVSAMFPNGTEIDAIRNRVLDELSKLEVNNTVQRTDLFGIGGSVKTIRKVLRYLDYIDSDDVMEVPVSILDDLLKEFNNNSKENYHKILSVNSDRINTFVPGLIITKTICEYFNITTLHFCKNGVREGIVQELVDMDNARAIPNMTVSNIVAYPNEDIEVLVRFDENVTGEVAIVMGNMMVYGNISNGTVSLRLPSLSPANYTAKVIYGGDKSYISQSQKIKISVKDVSITMMNDNARGYNSTYDYLVVLKDDEGNPLIDKLVLFNVAGNNYSARTTSAGAAFLKVGLKIGSYTVTVSSPVLSKNYTKAFKIVKSIQNNKNLNLYYNSNQKYKLKIIANNGKAESKGKSVKVIYDSKQYNYKTDANGYITIVINKNFKPGTHTLKIQYKGYSVSNKLVIKHALSSQKTTVKKAAKRIVLKAKLSLNNKNAIKNQKISFKFNGKTYSAKTNSKGIVQVSLLKSKFKKGTYTLAISYLNDLIKTTVKIL